MTTRFPLRTQPVTEICHVNGIAVQRYAGALPRDEPWSPWSATSDHDPPMYEMMTLFDGGGRKIDIDAGAFSVICEKWLLATAMSHDDISMGDLDELRAALKKVLESTT